MNILVTGANGQLGKCLFEICDRDSLKPNGVNFYFTGREDLDIGNHDAVEEYITENNIGIVINTAAYTNVDKAETDIVSAFKANAFGALFLAEAVRDTGGIMIQISTDYVYTPYPGWKGEPFKESCIDVDKTTPSTVYGASKLCAENNIINSGCNYLIIRTSWLYSMYGKNFLKTVRNNILNTRLDDTFKFVCDQIGTPTSAHSLAAFIYNMVLGIALKYDPSYDTFESDIINYSDIGACSWYDFACVINECLDVHATILPCYSHEYHSKAVRPFYSVMSKEKLNTDRYVPYNNTRHWLLNVKEVMKRIEDYEKNNK